MSHPLPLDIAALTVRVGRDHHIIMCTLSTLHSDPVLQASLCRSECGMCAKYEVLSPLSRCSFPSPESFLLIAVFAIRNISTSAL